MYQCQTKQGYKLYCFECSDPHGMWKKVESGQLSTFHYCTAFEKREQHSLYSISKERAWRRYRVVCLFSIQQSSCVINEQKVVFCSMCWYFVNNLPEKKHDNCNPGLVQMVIGDIELVYEHHMLSEVVSEPRGRLAGTCASVYSTQMLKPMQASQKTVKGKTGLFLE